MLTLSADQKKQLLSWLEEFLKQPSVTNEGVAEPYQKFDERRASAIPAINSILQKFLSGDMAIEEFKDKNEKICREHPYWGFKGFSGQMQLNQYVNNVSDPRRDPLLKECLKAPRNEAEAATKIDRLAEFLKGLKAKSENPKGLPRISQSYMLSYFWEIQDPKTWAVYYGSDKKVLEALGLDLASSKSPGSEYAEFMGLLRQVTNIFQNEGGRSTEKNPYWFIEHVLWMQFMKSGPGLSGLAAGQTKQRRGAKPQKRGTAALPAGAKIEGEWLPDIVKDLVDLSFNRETPWCKKHGVRPEKAFETKLRYAFTLLGFETTELGQGMGREPDGVAVSTGVPDGDYAVIYDAKARESRYTIGTNDREILEYIQKKTEELRKNRIQRFYFVIVASEFDPHPTLSAIREIDKKTRVPVILLRAADFLYLIDSKLQDIDIDHRRLEDLFLDTGLLTRDKISESLGLR